MLSTYLTIFILFLTTTHTNCKILKLSYLKIPNNNGFRVKVMDDNEPIIVFGSKKDTSQQAYCLNFVSSFESLSFNSTTGKHKIVKDSKKYFKDANKWNYIIINNNSFIIESINNKYCKLMQFKFIFESLSNNIMSLKYTYLIDGYKWINVNSNYVMQIDLKYCNDPNYNINSFDSSEEIIKKRQLMNILNSNDDSSDESYQMDLAIFKNTPLAYTKNCNNFNDNRNITVNMYETTNEKSNGVYIYLIFENYFGCNLVQDPYVFIDTSKIDEDYEMNNKYTLIIVGILVVIICILIIIMTLLRKHFQNAMNRDRDENGIKHSLNSDKKHSYSSSSSDITDLNTRESSFEITCQ